MFFLQSTFDKAMSILPARFVKPRNEIYVVIIIVIIIIAYRRQNPDESLYSYLVEFKSLASRYNCQAVTAEKNRNDDF